MKKILETISEASLRIGETRSRISFLLNKNHCQATIGPKSISYYTQTPVDYVLQISKKKNQNTLSNRRRALIIETYTTNKDNQTEKIAEILNEKYSVVYKIIDDHLKELVKQAQLTENHFVTIPSKLNYKKCKQKNNQQPKAS